MFNAKEILGQFMQSVQGETTPQTGNSTPAQPAGGGLLDNLGSLLKNPKTGSILAGGGGLLAGLLLGSKTGRSIGGNLAAAGGAVALGAMALKAYRSWQNKRSNTPQETSTRDGLLDFNILTEEQQQNRSRAMLSAVIEAAKADGKFDSREQQLIYDQMDKTGNRETAEWVQQEIRKPLDAGRIAAMVATPEMAAEIYLASFIIIDEQNENEKTYLDALAQKLGLDPQLRQEIEKQLSIKN